MILGSFPLNKIFKKLGMQDDLDCIIISSEIKRDEKVSNELDDVKEGMKYMVKLLKDIHTNKQEDLMH